MGAAVSKPNAELALIALRPTLLSDKGMEGGLSESSRRRAMQITQEAIEGVEQYRTLLNELADWAAHMGGFEAPVWDRLNKLRSDAE